MTLFDRVKRLCDQRGLSLSQLEENLEIGNGSAYKWKKHDPTLKMLKKLSEYFNVSVDYLLGSENIEHDPKNHTWDYVLSVPQKEQMLFEKIMLDSELSKRLIAYAEKLVEILDQENQEINKKKED